MATGGVNTNLTSDVILREALRFLHNNLAFVKGIDRQYDDKFAQTGGKIGESLRIRLPNKFEVREGAVMNAQAIVEESVTLQVATQRGVDLNFTSAELALDIDDFGKRFLQPAMAKLATKIDIIAIEEAYRNTYNQVGAPGTTPATSLVWLQATQKLNEFATPMDDERYACINPAAQAATVDGLKSLFNDGDSLSKQYKKGTMGTALGLHFAVDQNIKQHTPGAFAGSVLVNDTVVSGDTDISLDAFTDAGPTVKQGDIFTIAGVNAVNPESGEDTGSLMQFVVTADKTGATNAIADVAISPAIISSGAKKTVTALPADNAVITFAGTASTPYAVNIVHHRDAYTLATADLPLDDGADFAAREVYDNISMRIWRAGDIVNDKWPCRIDVLFGVKTIRPEMGCRVAG